ncbi:MAG: MotA/TolQ/ExbB proton channel family protein [bacterium]
MGHVEARQFRRAIDACKVGSRHPLVGVLRAGIMRANRREKEIERAMEREMVQALPGLHRRVGLLGFLANSCTLLGLLGTIFGLITAFASVSEASAAARQQALADGISQAMYTTAFGIVVAVPLLYFHHLLSERVDGVLNEMEGGATALLVAMTGAVEAPTDGQKTE